MWSIYIVRCSDNSLYTGITTNVEQRVRRHNFAKTGSKYVRSKRPAILVHTEPVETKSAALKREAQIKRLSHREKLTLIAQKDGI